MIDGGNHSPDGQSRYLGARQRGHEAVIGVRRLAEQIVFVGVLRRLVQETQIAMTLIGEKRGEVVFRHAECHRESR